MRSQPAACMRGPAMPTKRVPGARSRSAAISAAPRLSPEDSPATRPIVNEPAAVISG
jgi:hypothetical protein